jgi:hypothetical protein
MRINKKIGRVAEAETRSTSKGFSISMLLSNHQKEGFIHGCKRWSQDQ